MSLPKKVNIKGISYKVINKIINPDLYGLCDKDNKAIYINKLNCKSTKKTLETYAHELCHAYIREHNLDMVISDEVEELICLAFEEVIFKCVPFIIENKKDLGDV